MTCPLVDDPGAHAVIGYEILVARFVGFPSWQQLDNPAIGYYALGFQERHWDMGDRSVRCGATPRHIRRTGTSSAA